LHFPAILASFSKMNRYLSRKGIGFVDNATRLYSFLQDWLSFPAAAKKYRISC
jgi:hypothetical protein